MYGKSNAYAAHNQLLIMHVMKRETMSHHGMLHTPLSLFEFVCLFERKNKIKWFIAILLCIFFLFHPLLYLLNIIWNFCAIIHKYMYILLSKVFDILQCNFYSIRRRVLFRESIRATTTRWNGEEKKIFRIIIKKRIIHHILSCWKSSRIIFTWAWCAFVVAHCSRSNNTKSIAQTWNFYSVKKERRKIDRL